jgi:hypothetical protein
MLIGFSFPVHVNPDYFAAAMTDTRRDMNERIPGARLLRQGGAAGAQAPWSHWVSTP